MLFSFLTKQAFLKRRSTVLRLPHQSIFPALSITMLYHYAENLVLFISVLSVVILNVVMLSVVMLSVVVPLNEFFKAKFVFPQKHNNLKNEIKAWTNFSLEDKNWAGLSNSRGLY
jgi:hypothetical protein